MPNNVGEPTEDEVYVALETLGKANPTSLVKVDQRQVQVAAKTPATGLVKNNSGQRSGRY